MTALCTCQRCFGERVKAAKAAGTYDPLNTLDTAASLGWAFACVICGNKRCPHHADHRFVCTRSNEPGQEGVLATEAALASLAQADADQVLADGAGDAAEALRRVRGERPANHGRDLDFWVAQAIEERANICISSQTNGDGAVEYGIREGGGASIWRATEQAIELAGYAVVKTEGLAAAAAREGAAATDRPLEGSGTAGESPVLAISDEAVDAAAYAYGIETNKWVYLPAMRSALVAAAPRLLAAKDTEIAGLKREVIKLIEAFFAASQNVVLLETLLTARDSCIAEIEADRVALKRKTEVHVGYTDEPTGYRVDLFAPSRKCFELAGERPLALQIAGSTPEGFDEFPDSKTVPRDVHDILADNPVGRDK